MQDQTRGISAPDFDHVYAKQSTTVHELASRSWITETRRHIFNLRLNLAVERGERGDRN